MRGRLPLVGAALVAAVFLVGVVVVSASAGDGGSVREPSGVPAEEQHTPSIGDAFSVSYGGTASLTRLNFVRTLDSTRDRRVAIAKVTIKNQGDRALETRLASNSHLVTSTGDLLAARPSATVACNTARGTHMRVPSLARKSACVAFDLDQRQEPARLKMHLGRGADLMRWKVSD